MGYCSKNASTTTLDEFRSRDPVIESFSVRATPKMIRHTNLPEINPVLDLSPITFYLYSISTPLLQHNTPSQVPQENQIWPRDASTHAPPSTTRKQPEAKEEDLGKYCYAKVTANVARKDGYMMFYQACGRLIIQGKWEIIHRTTLYSEDEIKAEDGHTMSVLVNSNGSEPTENEILESFWKALEPARKNIMELNKKQWDVFEKVFKTAVEAGLEGVQVTLLKAIDDLFKIDLPEEASSSKGA
ncbi:hypothetical protein BDV35DRAFT_402108 [Aspergillus flavus]|uniref:Uncharacterized protein n=1 Tax=Aspergillus flavus TaxID=5059 RepID=A0A5N6HF84_ASPFL|nr:hypothetical protein BDV35DRAFT_402108 [Aspergillus flavus]